MVYNEHEITSTMNRLRGKILLCRGLKLFSTIRMEGSESIVATTLDDNILVVSLTSQLCMWNLSQISKGPRQIELSRAIDISLFGGYIWATTYDKGIFRIDCELKLSVCVCQWFHHMGRFEQGKVDEDTIYIVCGCWPRSYMTIGRFCMRTSIWSETAPLGMPSEITFTRSSLGLRVACCSQESIDIWSLSRTGSVSRLLASVALTSQRPWPLYFSGAHLFGDYLLVPGDDALFFLNWVTQHYSRFPCKHLRKCWANQCLIAMVYTGQSEDLVLQISPA